jgi:hypothetical protein
VADLYDERPPGDGLVNLTFAGTGAVVGTSIAASVLPDTFGVVHALLSGVLFTIGTCALLWAYALGVSRSRAVLITLPGLFFLAGGAAPPDVGRRFRIALLVEIVAVVGAAALHPYTNAAFGVLAPMFGLGLMAVWGGRHGSFPARPDDRVSAEDTPPDTDAS